MSTARVLIEQGGIVYRLLRFETSADGSLLAFLDRDPRPNRGGMSMNENGIFAPETNTSDRPLPSTKFSIHTTGEVHRSLGREKKGTIHIEPLHKLTVVHPIGFVSIPRPSRLDPLDGTRHVHDVAATLEIPEDISVRISFAIEVGPKPQQPQTFGVALNYEIYSTIVRMIPTPLALPLEMTEHFICGMPKVGPFDNRQIDKANAELEFYRAAHGNAHVFREDGGAYVVLAAVPMRIPPKLNIRFNREDLHIEQIPFDHQSQPSHKVRFWICDRGGRNKKHDLLSHITSVVLDAGMI
jgi:hypothetical protein